MSEAPKSKSAKSKTDPAPSSDTPKTPETASTESPKSTADGGGEKSSRASVGGASAVHYGFFSNVKTEEYRSGWDTIWGDKDKRKNKSNPKTKPQTNRTAKTKEPVLIDLDFADLPREIQEGLAQAARVQLKKSRINYDTRAKARGVAWRIECEVKR